MHLMERVWITSLCFTNANTFHIFWAALKRFDAFFKIKANLERHILFDFHLLCCSRAYFCVWQRWKMDFTAICFQTTTVFVPLLFSENKPSWNNYFNEFLMKTNKLFEFFFESLVESFLGKLFSLLKGVKGVLSFEPSKYSQAREIFVCKSLEKGSMKPSLTVIE